MPNAVLSEENAPLLRLVLQGLPKTANGSHGHWRAHAAQKATWKKKVFAAAWHLRPKTPLERARIVLTRHSSVEPDFDNLAISFKPLLDGLKQARWIVDDKRSNIGRPEYLWEKASPKAGHVVIEVFREERGIE